MAFFFFFEHLDLPALWKQLGKFEAFRDLALTLLPFPARCYRTGKSFSADGKQKRVPLAPKDSMNTLRCP